MNTNAARFHDARPRWVGKAAHVLLGVLGVLAVVAVVATVTLFIAARNGALDREARKVHCTSNLKFIYMFATSQAVKTGHFPLGAGPAPRAHESLNELVALYGEELPPKLFICPASGASPASQDAGGRFRLSEETLGYAWLATRAELHERKPLACCKQVHGGHTRGINVVWTDGSVHFVPVSALDPKTLLPPGLTR